MARICILLTIAFLLLVASTYAQRQEFSDETPYRLRAKRWGYGYGGWGYGGWGGGWGRGWGGYGWGGRRWGGWGWGR
ncbi:hypothetical protein QR680_016004 [Steinernema hermaphroditum]|uniref:Uncharacterized protein n=1 Tax=Steinernema hermaphroditum TaxID=289476 RepID=A0AA39H9P5_9BILA|nr:hypothetical protein QR680_016004 [Steinernema hermaphroditum]